MDGRLDAVRQGLQDGGYTCVILLDGKEYCSRERGVKPLISFLRSGQCFRGAIAADKTVGAGAAHLYVLLGVSALWANVISTSALKILKDNSIEVLYGECVPHIINRQGNGICPIEAAVANSRSSEEAYELIIAALARLKKVSTDTTLKVLRALADPNRLEIMELLAGGTKCGCELLDALKICQSTLSHHMRILCDAGLVDSRREGKWMYYSLRPQGAEPLRSLIDTYK